MQPKPTASILILTKNAGPRFRTVLDAVALQRPGFDYETLVLDSGSADDTEAIARSFPGVRFETIAPVEFGHGKTRNLAASMSRGDFLVYVTHDAVPQDANWLSELVRPFERQDVAGVFGRHVAHPEADVFARRDLDAHFANIANYPSVLSLDTDRRRYESDPGWRGLVHYFSNNNSALRRTVWERHPFPDVHFAEDQLWAKSIIEAGYSKAYAPSAVVAHSHSFTAMSQLRRAFDEAAAFEQLFGYRLGPSVGHLLVNAYRLAKRDIGYGRANRLGAGAILNRINQNIGLVTGHFLGTHNRRLPPKLREALSHDRRLLNSLRAADTA